MFVNRSKLLNISLCDHEMLIFCQPLMVLTGNFCPVRPTKLMMIFIFFETIDCNCKYMSNQ